MPQRRPRFQQNRSEHTYGENKAPFKRGEKTASILVKDPNNEALSKQDITTQFSKFGTITQMSTQNNGKAYVITYQDSV
jgi:hypothetical protein